MAEIDLEDIVQTTKVTLPRIGPRGYLVYKCCLCRAVLLITTSLLCSLGGVSAKVVLFWFQISSFVFSLAPLFVAVS